MQDALPLAILGTGFRPAYDIAPPPEIAAIAGAGFRPQLVETRRGGFPSNRFEHAMTSLGYLDAGIEAERAGYRGLFINTFGDYGMDALRSALSIPVVGAGEAALAVARTLGRKFAIVTIWPKSLNFIPEERLKSCGAEAECVGLINVMQEVEVLSVMAGAQSNAVSSMREGHATVVDRIVLAADRAVSELGAEVIVLGCTCMSPIAERVAARLSVPVVDSMRTGYKYLEMLTTLSLAQSKATYPSPAAGRLDIVGPALMALPIRQTDDDCEVCLAAEAS